MKSFLKISFFIIAMITTLEDVASSNNNRVNAFVSTVSMALPSAAVSGVSKVAPVANVAAKTSTKLLNQFNSAESLIQGAGKLERLGRGVRQGFVKGNPEAIFKSITNGGTALPSGAVRMSDRTFIRLYNSTTTGIPSIQINTPSMWYKIRITP